MNHKQRMTIEKEACRRRYGIADEKGAEYSQAGVDYREGADTLRNFKSVAERTGMSPVQCLMVYLCKHLDSIATTCREAEGMSDDLRAVRYTTGEGIISRLDDARNYLDLLECLLVDTGALWEILGNEPTRTSVGEDAPECGCCMVSGDIYCVGLSMGEDDPDYISPDDVLTPDELNAEIAEQVEREESDTPNGIVCYDGVVRPRAMPEGTPVETPIYRTTPPLTPRPDPETGEL